MAADEYGAETGVAQGMTMRNDAPALDAAAPLAARLTLPRVAAAVRPGGGLPAPPPCHGPPDHTLPHALAPPAA
jgi:hypothetical protein